MELDQWHPDFKRLSSGRVTDVPGGTRFELPVEGGTLSVTVVGEPDAVERLSTTEVAAWIGPLQAALPAGLDVKEPDDEALEPRSASAGTREITVEGVPDDGHGVGYRKVLFAVDPDLGPTNASDVWRTPKPLVSPTVNIEVKGDALDAILYRKGQAGLYQESTSSQAGSVSLSSSASAEFQLNLSTTGSCNYTVKESSWVQCS